MTSASCFPSIMLTNLRSIRNKIENLREFVHVFHPDILALTETWRGDSDGDAFEINDFQSLFRNRMREDKIKGGGIGLLIRNNISIQQVQFPIQAEVEALSAIIRPSLLPRKTSWLGIILLYHPPQSRFADELASFITSEIDRMLAINHRALMMVLGDFNDLDLSRCHSLSSFAMIPSPPTRLGKVLDRCYINIKDLYHSQLHPPIGTSDHNTIIFTKLGIHKQLSSHKIISIRQKRHSNFIRFGEAIASHDWSLWEQIDDYKVKIDIFYDFLCELYEISFPVTSIKISINSCPWIDQSLAGLIKKRSKLYSSRHRNSIEYNLLNLKIKAEIMKNKDKIGCDLIKESKQSLKKFFVKVNLLTNMSRASGPIIFEDRSLSETNAEMTSYFRNILTKHQSAVALFDSYAGSDSSFDLVTEYDTFVLLSNLKNSSYKPPCDIPADIYKEFAVLLAKPVSIIINLSLANAFVPVQWKMGYLIPLPKVPHPNSPLQVRPIILLSPLAKLAERLVVQNLRPILDHHIDARQFGGIAHRSTSDYLAIYIHQTLQHLDKSNAIVNSIITDFQKAFDNIDHALILNKLVEFGVPGWVTRWVSAFLNDRTIIIKNGQSVGQPVVCSSGIPQGSVSGGVLFNLVVNDLMRNELALKFIDDLTVSLHEFSSSVSRVQSVFTELAEQAAVIKLPLNIQKCAILSHNFTRNCSIPEVRLNNVCINNVSKISILGLSIQSDLKWDDQIRKICSQASRRFFILYKMKNLNLNKKCLLQLYLTYIRPIMEYGSEIWHHALSLSLSLQVERIQKRALRIIFGSQYITYMQALELAKLSSLQSRRLTKIKKMAPVFFRRFPEFKPLSNEQTSGRSTRHSGRLVIPRCRTVRFQKSPIIQFARAINSLST